MIGIDTNCLLRFSLRDDVAQHKAIETRIVRTARAGDDILISDVVLAEFIWVLKSQYAFTRSMQAEALRGLLDAQHFAFESKDCIQVALRAFESSKADFSDCLIGAKNRRLGCETTYSFDKAAQWLPTFSAV